MTIPRTLAAVLVSGALLTGGAALAPAASAVVKPTVTGSTTGHLRTVVTVQPVVTTTVKTTVAITVKAGATSDGHLRSISAGHLR